MNTSTDCESGSDHPDGYAVANRQGTTAECRQWARGSLSGMEQKVEDFIMLLRVAHKLKHMNYLLLKFSIKYFWTVVDHWLLKPQKAKSCIRVGALFYLQEFGIEPQENKM